MASLKFLVVIVFALTVFCSLPGRTGAEMNVVEVINASFPALYQRVILYPVLVEALSNPNASFTVFAPINSAFNGISINTSIDILSYHVASGIYGLSNLTLGNYVPTLLNPFPLANYSQVLIVGNTNSTTTLNGVVVQGQPQNATNGIVYAIESVLTPPSKFVEDIVSDNYKTLNSLVTLSGLSLKIHPLTLFAPTDAAFASLPTFIINYLLLNNSLSRPDLTNILLHHAVGVPVYTGELARGQSKEFSTLLPGTIVTVQKLTNTTVVVNDNIDIVQPDVLAQNGVVQGIAEVLVPTNFSFTLEKVISGLGATSYLQQVKYLNLESDLLNDTIPRTLFVPTNAAIGTMNLTREGLLYHAIPNSFNESQLESGYLLHSLLSLPSLDNLGQMLKFTIQVNTSGTLLVNGVSVHNGTTTIGTPVINYVYLIDTVLAAPSYVPEVLSSNGYSTLVKAVQEVNLTSVFNNSLTVFAPTDDAFEMLPPGLLGYLMNRNYSSPELLTSLLWNHIIEETKVYYSNAIPVGTITLPTLSYGSNVTIINSNGNVTVDNAAVVYPDILAANGVVHGINRVLVPATVSFSVQNVLEGLGNFTKLLGYLSDTGLLNLLNNTNLTIFAPDDDAFDNVSDLDSLAANTTRLTEVLKAHVVFMNVSMLYPNETLNTASGQRIFVINPEEIELKNDQGETIGTPANIGTITYGRNGYAYGITRVLGVEQTSSSGGLKLWQKILIVAGSIVGGLLLLVLVVAVGYFIYHVYFKNKNGYRKIND